MKIGFNKVIGIAFLMLSLISCCLAAVFVRTDEFPPPVTAAGFWLGLLVGILLFTGTYIEISQNYVIVKSPFRFVTKRYAFASVQDFSIDRGKIYLLRDGLPQKLAVASWMADKRGWISFVKWMSEGGQPSEARSDAVP